MAINITARHRRSIQANRDGLTTKQLAAVYGVRIEVIRRIKFGSNKTRHGNSKLTPQTADEIRRLRDEGVPQWKLARRFGVSDATVSLVVRDLIWVRS